ncbi:MAG: hypothetical protein AAF492_11965, partial [Verrucomicrobiota bacterium]
MKKWMALSLLLSGSFLGTTNAETMIARRLTLKAEAVERIEKHVGRAGRYETTSKKVYSFFKSMGVPFPQGSFFAYETKTASILMANEPEHFRALYDALNHLQRFPCRVEVSCAFVTFDKALLDGIARRNTAAFIDSGMAYKLWK